MVLSAKENEELLKIMESTLNSEFKSHTVKELAEYMGNELTTNPPTNEKEYKKAIKTPMLKIFSKLKSKLETKLHRKIHNKPYETYEPGNKLYMLVALYGRYGWTYFDSSQANLIGSIANSFENSPLNKNLINAMPNSDGSYTSFNGNILPSEMSVLLNKNPDYCTSSVGYFATKKNLGYRACRKLVNDYTGIIGGVLVISLFNV